MVNLKAGLQFSEESFRCNAAIPSTSLLSSSRDTNWSALLVDHSRSFGECGEYRTVPTSDQTLVAVTHGEAELFCHSKGGWQKSRYAPGRVGRTQADVSDRLHWRVPRAKQSFDKIHIFIPALAFVEAADHLRQPGGSTVEHPNFSFAFSDPMILQASKTLLTAAKSGAPNLYAEVIARMLAQHLLTFHSNYGAGDGDSRSAGHLSDKRIARVVEYMTTHLDQAISLDALASEAGVSKFHFSRLFREKTGLTPVRHLALLRLESARRQLVNSDASISQIAGKCGYPNPVHFSMAYRRHYGMSPREFRRMSLMRAITGSLRPELRQAASAESADVN